MKKQIIMISNRRKVVIKCKYCKVTMHEYSESPVPSDELMNRMEQHALMSHSGRYWVDWVKTND